MEIYWSSDYHLNHQGILDKMNRPFSSVEEMNEAIIDNHNSIVKPRDTIYLLGDIAWRGLQPLLYRMNGQKNLIKGNHDHKRELKNLIGGKYFQSIQDVKFISVGEIEIFMSHFPHRAWPKSHYGSWHLFGHTHGMLSDYGKSCDVGVDAWDFKPVSIDELKERFKDCENTMHHPLKEK